MPEQISTRPTFDSAHDSKGDRRLRLLASFLAVAFLLLAGFSAAGQPAPQKAQAQNTQTQDVYLHPTPADGEVEFRPDLCGFDKKHAQALEGRERMS